MVVTVGDTQCRGAPAAGTVPTPGAGARAGPYRPTRPMRRGTEAPYRTLKAVKQVLQIRLPPRTDGRPVVAELGGAYRGLQIRLPPRADGRRIDHLPVNLV